MNLSQTEEKSLESHRQKEEEKKELNDCPFEQESQTFILYALPVETVILTLGSVQVVLFLIRVTHPTSFLLSLYYYILLFFPIRLILVLET